MSRAPRWLLPTVGLAAGALILLGSGGKARAMPQEPKATPPPGGPSRRFRLTSYWVPDIQASAAPAAIPIYDKETGDELLKVSEATKRTLDLEGSARLPDGRVVAWTETGSDEYKVLPEGWLAQGTGGRKLTPFKSVAADQGNSGKQPWKDSITRDGGLLPVGTKLYIKELDGFSLPDGTTHDGWVTVEDTGTAIFGVHLDLFVGPQKNRIRHPPIVTVSGDGVEEIPGDYVYGLVKVENYKDQRPPKPRDRNS